MPFSEWKEVIPKPLGNKYIKKPKTIGQHIRIKRLALGLLQKEVADQFRLTEDCIRFWEIGKSTPQMSHLPKIISFLGFNPFEKELTTTGDKILMYRIVHGLSYKAMAEQLKIDESTVRRWEKNITTPVGKWGKIISKIIR